MLQRIKSNPVLLVQTVLSLLISFGLLAWTDAQAQDIVVLVGLLFGGGLVARSQVSPVSKVDGDDG